MAERTKVGDAMFGGGDSVNSDTGAGWREGCGKPGDPGKEAERTKLCVELEKDSCRTSPMKELDWVIGEGCSRESAGDSCGGTTKRIRSRAASMASRLVYWLREEDTPAKRSRE